MMEIRCCGASADCIAAEVLTSGMTGKQVRFAFDETWGGLSKTAVFVGAVKESVQLEQETVEIPASVLAVAGVPLVIGVRGESEDGALVIPTVYARCGMILPGADTVPAGAEVTPSQAQQLQNQIDELKKAGGGEPSGGAVSSVNGQTGTVVLNAEDVGALPDTTQIPAVPAALPNPYKLTFTGAVSSEYDGSAAVSVEIPEGGGGDSSVAYSFINEVTTEALLNRVLIEIPNGITEVFAYIMVPATTDTNAIYAAAWSEDVMMNGRAGEVGLDQLESKTFYLKAHFLKLNNYRICDAASKAYYAPNVVKQYAGGRWGEITGNYFIFGNQYEPSAIPVGTEIKLYGR